jgi:membrane protease YdiL (CAAX protease family)
MMAASVAFARSLGLRATLVVAELLLVGPALLALIVWNVPIGGLALTPPGRRTTLLCLAAGAGLWIGSLGLLELQYAVWAPPPGYLEAFRRLHAALRPAGPLDALVSVLAIAIAPAVCEELLTRGIDLPSFRRGLGDTGAVVAAAIVFALIHFDPYRLAFALVVGLALGLLRVRTGLLLPSILAHATLNTLTFAAAPFLDDPTQDLPEPRPALGAALLAAGAVATGLVFRALRRRVDARPPVS